MIVLIYNKTYYPLLLALIFEYTTIVIGDIYQFIVGYLIFQSQSDKGWPFGMNLLSYIFDLLFISILYMTMIVILYLLVKLSKKDNQS